MLKRATFLTVLLILAILFVAGVGRLCLLRFRSGDVYPPLSSLRSDPLGAKALYDALAETGDHELRRNYRAIHKLNSERDCTFIYLGTELNGFTVDWDDLRQLASAGNRVVIAFNPVTFVPVSKTKATPAEAGKSPTPEPSKKKSKKDTKEESEDESPFLKKWVSWSDALKKIGLNTHTEKEWEHKALSADATPEATKLVEGLEQSISWHSCAWIECSGTNQKALYDCEKKPVIIECSMGRGTLVFTTDSYFLSNEALQKERAAHLLAAIIGSKHAVVFDEFHLHSVEQSSISTLIRDYRLEGVFAVFALLAVLYVWKNASPLVPRAGDENVSGGSEETVSGRDATGGFVNLLRRSIPPSRIIGVCVDEWNNAFAHRRGNAPIPAPDSGANPVTQFSELAKKLSNKRTPR